jgi:hypothetical protein
LAWGYRAAGDPQAVEDQQVHHIAQEAMTAFIALLTVT